MPAARRVSIRAAHISAAASNGATSAHSLDILVVGAGIAGLATALALHKVGLKVRVLESASSPRAEGAALGLWSNAWRALEVLGVADTLREDHLELKRVEIVRGSGETLTTFPFSACKVGATGQEVRAVKRAALQEALAAALPPGCITYNARVVGVSEAAPRSGVCGQQRCRDGSRSAVVDHLQLPGNTYSGYIAYRGIAKVDPSTIGLPSDTVRQIWGNGVRAGMIPLDSSSVYWFATQNLPASMGAPGANPGLDMRPASVRANVLQCIRGWAWGLEQALDSTPDADLSCRGITDRWTLGAVGSGCVTLVGDALHPMTPNLGQGGCVALEDSVVLARTVAQTCSSRAWTSMGSAGQTAALSASLRSYEQERSRRCLPITVRSNLMGLALQIDNPLVGLRVRVLESASSPRAEGAALGLWSNAWRALEVLGVADTLREDHLELKRVEIVSDAGETLTTFPFSACKVGATGQEVRAVKRAALQEALAAALPPGCITYNARVVGVSEAAPGQGSAVSSGAGVRVRLQDGREERCGLLIGADGSRSAVVDHLQLPANSYAGYIAYRGIARLPPNKLGMRPDTARQILGHGVRAGMIPLDKDSVYWFVTHNVPASMGAPGSKPGLDMRPASVRARVQQCITGWAWGVEQALDSTLDADLSCRGITDRWTFGKVGGGCVTLAGDALHPTTPNLGQGGCMALEDSVVLARTIAQTCRGDAWTSMGGEARAAALSASLRSYEQERATRCLPVTVRSNLIGFAFQMDNPLVCQARNTFVKKLFSPVHFLDHTSYDCGKLPVLGTGATAAA
ncbi:MAG: hypothetical protein WDW36_002758 [Sanguina aurantia]